MSKQVFHPQATLKREMVSGVISQIAFFSQLGMMRKNQTDVVKAIHRGFPASSVERLKEYLGVSQKDLYYVAGLNAATVGRRLKSETKRLNASESDRVYRIASVYYAALNLFEGDENAAVRWLKTPARALGGETPFKHLDTEAGADEVRDLIGRIEHGIVT